MTVMENCSDSFIVSKGTKIRRFDKDFAFYITNWLATTFISIKSLMSVQLKWNESSWSQGP